MKEMDKEEITALERAEYVVQTLKLLQELPLDEQAKVLEVAIRVIRTQQM